MNVSLDPATVQTFLQRLAALGVATQPQPTAPAIGPQPTATMLRWQEFSQRTPVLDRMDQVARMCADYASGHTVAARATELADELEWLRRELRAATAAAIDRAVSLGIIDTNSAAELSTLADTEILDAA